MRTNSASIIDNNSLLHLRCKYEHCLIWLHDCWARTILTSCSPENLSLKLNLDQLMLTGNTFCNGTFVLPSSLIEICQFSYSVYYAFLKYLYTDKVDELSTDNVISKFSLFTATSDIQVCHQRLSSAFDLLLIFLCSLIQALTPPPSNAVLANSCNSSCLIASLKLMDTCHI